MSRTHLGEHKFVYPETPHFVLEAAILAKISREAIFAEAKMPLVVLTFEGLAAEGVDEDWALEPGPPSEGALPLLVRDGAKSVRVTRDFVRSVWASPGRVFSVKFAMPKGVRSEWRGSTYSAWLAGDGAGPVAWSPGRRNRNGRA